MPDRRTHPVESLEKARALRDAGSKALDAQDVPGFHLNLDRSNAILTNAIRENPNLPILYLDRGYGRLLENQVALFTGAYQVDMRVLKGAVEDFTRAIDLMLEQGAPAESIASAWREKGQAYKLRGDYLENEGSSAPEANDELDMKWSAALKKAVACFDRAIELDPNDAAARAGRGQALLSGDFGGNRQVALSDFYAAVNLDPANLEAREGLLDILEDDFRSEDLSVADTLIDQCVCYLRASSNSFSVQSRFFGVLQHILYLYPNHPKALEGLHMLRAVDKDGRWENKIVRYIQ